MSSILCFRSIATTSNPVQIIGMSATLPNLDILARWLDADLFKTEFRPVPLTEMVKIGSDIYDSNLTKLRSLNLGQTFKNDEDHIIPLCLETIKDGCSVLIFCPTKNWCEKLADSIAREFYSLKNEPPKVKAQGEWILKNYFNSIPVLSALRKCFLTL